MYLYPVGPRILSNSNKFSPLFPSQLKANVAHVPSVGHDRGLAACGGSNANLPGRRVNLHNPIPQLPKLILVWRGIRVKDNVYAIRRYVEATCSETSSGLATVTRYIFTQCLFSPSHSRTTGGEAVESGTDMTTVLN